MFRDVKLWLALGGVALGGWLIVSAIERDRSPLVTDDELPRIVFVCRSSQELFVGAARGTPAKHPQTGQPTLLPGWYCPKCKTWHAGPPSDAAARLPEKVLCPKTRAPLRREGPLPKDGQEI
jgi:hypothetical protein